MRNIFCQLPCVNQLAISVVIWACMADCSAKRSEHFLTTCQSVFADGNIYFFICTEWIILLEFDRVAISTRVLSLRCIISWIKSLSQCTAIYIEMKTYCILGIHYCAYWMILRNWGYRETCTSLYSRLHERWSTFHASIWSRKSECVERWSSFYFPETSSTHLHLYFIQHAGSC